MAFVRALVIIAILLTGWVAFRAEGSAHAGIPAAPPALVQPDPV